MDSAEYPSLLALMSAHARLASDARRVEQIVDGYMAERPWNQIERLFHAATVDDWGAIAETTRRLAQPAADDLAADVLLAAKSLSRTIRRNRPTHRSPALLGELLQACRTMQQQRRAAS